MKQRFLNVSLGLLACFLAVNLLSYFYWSSPHGTQDGIRAIGFPWVFWEAGGFAYRNEFHLRPFIANLITAGAFSTAGGMLAARKAP